MPEKQKYKCRNCGNEFVLDVYTDEMEKREAERQGMRFGPAQCPKCNRTDVDKI